MYFTNQHVRSTVVRMRMGKRLKAELDDRNMKPVDLCALVPDLDIGTLSAIYQRDSRNSKFAPAIAKALNVELHWLITGELPKFRITTVPGDDTVINPDIPGVYSVVYSPDNLSELTIDQLRSALAARLANEHEQEAKHQISLLDYETWKSRPSGEDPTPRMRRTDHGPILKKVAQRK
jgi:hypothetical protein